MTETLLERPPEAMTMPEVAEVPRIYGVTEKAVGDVAIHGSGLAGQLSIEHEPGIQWPVTDEQKGIVPSVIPEGNYFPPPEMSPLEEATHAIRAITHEKAYADAKSGKIGWDEFYDKIADKNPRTYQQPLLKQDGQVFSLESPVVDNDPHKGIAAIDGTFWHASNQLMEPGDRVLPSGEVPDSVHEANKSGRRFNSGSAPNGTGYENKRGGEKDFAFGYRRDLGRLPTDYGDYIYKVSSPNTQIVPVSGGDEVWAEGGATVEKRMHPDFAHNYAIANHYANTDPFQPGLPGMENGLQFVPEADLDVSSKEFYEKHVNDARQNVAEAISVNHAGPEDVALPGFEDHGKPRPVTPVGTPNSEYPNAPPM
jgi:hypothetical protein